MCNIGKRGWSLAFSSAFRIERETIKENGIKGYLGKSTRLLFLSYRADIDIKRS